MFFAAKIYSMTHTVENSIKIMFPILPNVQKSIPLQISHCGGLGAWGVSLDFQIPT